MAADQQVAAQWAKANEKVIKAHLDTVRLTLLDVGRRIRTQSRADIAAAGNFSGQWLSGFTASVSSKKGTIKVFHKLAIATVFQTGKDIKGKPLMWLPLGAAPKLTKSSRQPLFFVRRGDIVLAGAPRAHGLTFAGEFLYIGVPAVHLQKRFHLREIGEQIAGTIPATFEEKFKSSNVNG